MLVADAARTSDNCQPTINSPTIVTKVSEMRPSICRLERTVHCLVPMLGKPRRLRLTRSVVAVSAMHFLSAFAAAGDAQSSSKELPHAKPQTVGMSADRLALVKPALQQFVDDKKVPGAIAVVARRGKVVLFEAVGWRDIQATQPMEKDSILRFYSMTKPITSVGIMMLVEDGKLRLDDAVSRYVPEFTQLRVFVAKTGSEVQLEKSEREMTIRDLLRHTSGLTYGFFGDTHVDQEYRAAQVLGRSDTLQATIGKLGRLPTAVPTRFAVHLQCLHRCARPRDRTRLGQTARRVLCRAYIQTA